MLLPKCEAQVTVLSVNKPRSCSQTKKTSCHRYRFRHPLLIYILSAIHANDVDLTLEGSLVAMVTIT